MVHFLFPRLKRVCSLRGQRWWSCSCRSKRFRFWSDVAQTQRRVEGLEQVFLHGLPIIKNSFTFCNSYMKRHLHKSRCFSFNYFTNVKKFIKLSPGRIMTDFFAKRLCFRRAFFSWKNRFNNFFWKYLTKTRNRSSINDVTVLGVRGINDFVKTVLKPCYLKAWRWGDWCHKL